jgi:hypothetical protein
MCIACKDNITEPSIQCPSCSRKVHQACGGMIYANRGMCLYCHDCEIFEIPPGSLLQTMQSEINILRNALQEHSVPDPVIGEFFAEGPEGIRVYTRPRPHCHGPQVPIPRAHRVFQKILHDILHNQPEDLDLPREPAGKAWFKAVYHEHQAKKCHARSLLHYRSLGQQLEWKEIELAESGAKNSIRTAAHWAVQQYKCTTGRIVSEEHQRDVLTKARRAHRLLMDLTDCAILKITSVTPTDLRKLSAQDVVQINFLIREYLEQHGNTEEIED